MPHDEFVAEDPMGLNGVVLPGEEGQLERMAESVVREYVWMGWDERRLMKLFVNPNFMATHRVYRQKGEEYVRELIRGSLKKWRPASDGPQRTEDDARVELRFSMCGCSKTGGNSNHNSGSSACSAQRAERSDRAPGRSEHAHD